ncbi:MAG: hypothetical protein K6T30_08435 [Alicyclobacillus sp.]|nr:hypothetical protein [Alicyclobacillus sp.]
MADGDREWRERFREMSEVPFTDDLRRRVLFQAQERLALQDQGEATAGRSPAQEPEPAQSPRHGRRADWRSWWACAGGLAGAATLVWLVWTYSAAPPLSRLPGTHAQPADRMRQPVTLQATGNEAAPNPRGISDLRVAPGSAYGLQRAPVSIGDVWIGAASGLPPDSVVYATLTNVGTRTLAPQDLVGVLSFHRRGAAGTMWNGDWLAFVGGPGRPLAPGDTATWSFRPLGAPADARGRLTEQPSLVFYSRGMVPVERADVVWKIPPSIEVAHLRVAPRMSWAGGQSMEVSATLVNVSGQAVDLSRTLALIWFAPGAVADWTRPDVVRFLNRIPATPGGGLVLQPGAKRSVSFRLIGPAGVDVRRWVVRMALIER